MATIEVTFPQGGQPGKILKWRVSLDTMVSAGRVLLLYNYVSSSDDEGKLSSEKKLRAARYGRVVKLLVKEGDIVQPGQVIMELEGCKHPAVMKDLCAECGADLRIEDVGVDGKNSGLSQASVPMVHSIPELKVSMELAIKIGKEDEQRLLKDKKLALLVDLDQTIVHTTNDNISPNMKDVYHYQLYGPQSPWYHTRLRPNTRHFLSEMSQLYELHICTFGARNYAHTVAGLLDKDGTLFSHRILSRDECFDPASKTANLKALFPCGDNMVCIIDDREDVWQGCGNLVQVKPYHFFRHTGDIHAPPGLEKTDVMPSSELLDINEPNEKDFIDENARTILPQEDEIQFDNVKQEKIDDKNKVREHDIRQEQSEETLQHASENDKSIAEDVSIDDKRDLPVENKEIGNLTKQEELKENDVKENVKEMPKEGEEKQDEEDEDDDDYLLYLEDILRRIHTEFYKEVDSTPRPSLRDIIPKVRSRVLNGLCLTFSGMIPTHQRLQDTRAYKVARAFGAEVIQDLTDKTTHLVAVRPGTAKANAAKKNSSIKIVNPDWLWTCAERWEHVEERMFPLTAKAKASRVPPPHCSSPERTDEENEKAIRDSFANSINPLMSFSAEEIEFMDKEVEEDMEDADTNLDLEDVFNPDEPNKRLRNSSESEDSANDDEEAASRKKRKVCSDDTLDEWPNENDESGNEDDDDLITRFRRGEDISDDLDLGDNSQDSIDDRDIDMEDQEDEREWNAMGAALEREFLSE